MENLLLAFIYFMLAVLCKWVAANLDKWWK